MIVIIHGIQQIIFVSINLKNKKIIILKLGASILNNTLTYGNQCVIGSYQCNSNVDLTCTGNCTCKNSKIWNITSCVCPAGTFLNSSNLCRKISILFFFIIKIFFLKKLHFKIIFHVWLVQINVIQQEVLVVIILLVYVNAIRIIIGIQIL